mmetsp:Transcript_4284/g.7810  ORF Transcript_4284/g.7810 Transcript_4284/m.7810 type:complete len:215 (+) Transcript_4284:2195-2839(+)
MDIHLGRHHAALPFLRERLSDELRHLHARQVRRGVRCGPRAAAVRHLHAHPLRRARLHPDGQPPHRRAHVQVRPGADRRGEQLSDGHDAGGLSGASGQPPAAGALQPTHRGESHAVPAQRVPTKVGAPALSSLWTAPAGRPLRRHEAAHRRKGAPAPPVPPHSRARNKRAARGGHRPAGALLRPPLHHLQHPRRLEAHHPYPHPSHRGAGRPAR